MDFMKFFKIIILFSIFNTPELHAPRFQTLEQARNKLSRHKKYSNFKTSLNNQQGIYTFDVFPKDVWAEIIEFLIGDQEHEASCETIQAILNLRLTSRNLKNLIHLSIIEKVYPKNKLYLYPPDKKSNKPVLEWLNDEHIKMRFMQGASIEVPLRSLDEALSANRYRLLEKILKRRSISEPIPNLHDKIEFSKNHKDKNFSNKKIIELLENRLTSEKRAIYFLCIISIMGAFLEEYILANLSNYISGIENDICYDQSSELYFRRSPITINTAIKFEITSLNNYFKIYETKNFIPVSLDFEGPKTLTNFLITKNFKDLNKSSNELFKIDEQDNYKSRIKNRLSNPLAIAEIVSCVIVFMFLLDFHLYINKIIQ